MIASTLAPRLDRGRKRWARGAMGSVSAAVLTTALGLGFMSAASAAAAQQVLGAPPAEPNGDIARLSDQGGAGPSARGADATPIVMAQNSPTPTPAPTAAPVDNPYAHLGTNPLVRFWNYQKLELGQSSAPVDPTAPAAPPALRAGWPAVPQSTPPMPFTDWPYGGTTLIGDNRTASVDSPFMVAIADTSVGKWLGSTGIQAYGWIDYGGNLSSSKLKGGNAPAAYDYEPNNIQLDQAVIYVERTPDTVQTDHIDWGFRLSAIYGENYRYTTAYGVASYQLLNHNHFYGYDFPMVYGELWIPRALQGLMIRVGRYISLPDIEAQLAPNNYMYTHSITYTLDNYTNEGVQTTLAVTKQIMLQVGISDGTEAALWNAGVSLSNPFADTKANLLKANAFLMSEGLPTVSNANPLYPNANYRKDPGAQPTGTLCARFQSQDGFNDLNLCANGVNKGAWGYNNLQWYGFTYYHTFSKHWHIAVESYEEHEDGVPNAKNPLVGYIVSQGGTPFANIPFNAPDMAQCKNPAVYRCEANSVGAVDYLNYSPDLLDNISLRTEYYDDMQGQRTGVAAVYYDIGIGWQHWLSPQIELRPEFTYYHASALVFNDGNAKQQRVFSGDVIWHF
jgi:hypothetical protein